MKKIDLLVLSACFGFITAGCAAMLPKTEKTADFYWQSHKEIETAVSMIEPGKTTRLQKIALGFDPRRVPNVTRLNYFQVRDTVLGQNQNVKVEDLPDGLQECLRAKDLCAAEAYLIESTHTKEEGSFVANKTGTKVTRRTTGWKYGVIIFMKLTRAGTESDNDSVLYLTRNDDPNINQVEVKKDPLGWWNTIWGGAAGAVRKLIGF